VHCFGQYVNCNDWGVMMSKKEILYQRIEQHGQDLNNIFDTEYDNIALCKKLFKLENKAHNLATLYCNGDINCEEWEEETIYIADKVSNILNIIDDDIFFINGDPRGYALKLHEEFSRDKGISKDWGGYGLIAPDFREGL
jgi:hypothetical protein